MVVKLGNARVLLDCPVDVQAALSRTMPAPLAAAAPPPARGSLIKGVSPAAWEFEDARRTVLVDAASAPFCAPAFAAAASTHALDCATLDAVLFSAHDRMAGLPYLIRAGFRGSAIATGPTARLGRMAMREMAAAYWTGEESAEDEASAFRNVPEWLRTQLPETLGRWEAAYRTGGLDSRVTA